MVHKLNLIVVKICKNVNVSADLLHFKRITHLFIKTCVFLSTQSKLSMCGGNMEASMASKNKKLQKTQKHLNIKSCNLSQMSDTILVCRNKNNIAVIDNYK